MDKIAAIIRKKPVTFVVISFLYFILVSILKWRLTLSIDILWFLLGGLLGIYFLDISEEFFQLSPSPFRTIIFQTLFGVVSFFIVTSSGSFLASGLVLSLYLSMLLWQVGEWKIAGNLSSWYRMTTASINPQAQQWILWGFTGLFILETFLFIR